MEKLFDSHAHYYDKRFAHTEGGVGGLLDRLFKDEVAGIINVGTEPNTSRRVVADAAKWPHMYAAVGLHPTDGQELPDLEAAIAEIAAMVTDPEKRRRDKIVAIGEIGLDYYWEHDKAKQSYLFEEQLKLAIANDLPVIIHDRDAHGDVFDTVCRYPAARGVFHSYSGSAEMARDLVRRGWYISFSGVATFKNAPKVREAIAAVPTDRLLIETDAPYLAPVPYRGQCNHSGLARYTAEAVAAVKEMDPDDLIRLTRENTCRLFGIA